MVEEDALLAFQHRAWCKLDYLLILKMVGDVCNRETNQKKASRDNTDYCLRQRVRSDKPKGHKVACPSVVNMAEHNNSSRDCKGVDVGNKANGSGTKGSVDGMIIFSIGGLTIRDDIFDENRLSSVPRPSLRIPNRIEYIGGLVVPEEVTEEFVQQPEPELRKGKRNKTPKNFGPEF
ncbi:hypothetical protein Tco_0747875 [Tanacetum coccineum]|uniref:Uncharacterized protein n=1 Tax=Tanacetum coccineum TaxID=301880 RepID=A0ABQ4YTZ3_9ASTR